MLRVRSAALALALSPAAVAVVLLGAVATGHTGGAVWHVLRWAAVLVAVLALLAGAAVAAVVTRARPAVSPTVPVPEESAPELYRLVRDLAGRLDVPVPSAIALTPDCDSWLEDRSHPGHTGGTGLPRTAARRRAAGEPAPVLVIGSPFIWWMRVAELRALLAPVVAGTGPATDPDIAAARRFVRGLDAAVAVCAPGGLDAPAALTVPLRPALALVGRLARLMLRGCRTHIAEMERAVAAAASENAQTVDYGLRIVAQEQVGLAYAGWDRLLTRVALPAWRMGRWPSRLDVGVVCALTELSRRDRLAEGFETRLGERPACDLLESPGAVDEATSLLAARLFHGGPARPGPAWAPVSWEAYPRDVVDRGWRTDAARLHRVLDEPSGAAPEPGAPPTGSVAAYPPAGSAPATSPPAGAVAAAPPGRGALAAAPAGVPSAVASADPAAPGPVTLARVLDRLARGGSEELAARLTACQQRDELRREEELAAATAGAGDPGDGAGVGPEAEPPTPVYQLLPPRGGRDLLADHVTAMVCCAAVDTAGAVPGLDWLDGPALLVGGVRRCDLAQPVQCLVEHGDPAPLRAWLAAVGVRLEQPVRLV
ncbi:hypothetical protein [Streptantibioticus silvisoli]|uniref:hypothetical protein n=1 Tax=Streptantibioticus silvisoli TaxID=2705255 RepID=UPI0024A8EE48|nr:hypothetical protein [Streptantibioticus silvisoli]